MAKCNGVREDATNGMGARVKSIVMQLNKPMVEWRNSVQFVFIYFWLIIQKMATHFHRSEQIDNVRDIVHQYGFCVKCSIRSKKNYLY